MDDLIKIASNGQWILEKGKRPGNVSDADMRRMVEDYKTKLAAPKPAAPRPTSTSSMPQGLRPAVLNTGANPDKSKEEVAALRTAFGRSPAPVQAKTPAPQKDTKLEHASKVSSKLDMEQQEADRRAKVKSGNKEAFAAGVAFLAQHGNKGYQALNELLQQKKIMDQAHETGKMPVKPKRELQPPIEMTQDEKGNRVTRERVGRFHNEGAVTTGKVVHRPVFYEDKETGEKHRRMIPSQEHHHWSWDHNNKKWNHVKTTYGKR